MDDRNMDKLRLLPVKTSLTRGYATSMEFEFNKDDLSM